MVRVSIDVPALRGVVKDLENVVDDVFDEWTEVSKAAGRALASAPALQKLGDHTSAVTEAASDLEARIDLAILVNTGDDGPPSLDSPLTYTLPPGQQDTGAAARYLLGQEMAELGESMYRDGADDWQVELLADQLERWGDDDDVMASTFSSLGPDGTIYLTTELGYYALDNGDADAAQSAVDAIRHGLETASHAWSPANAERFGRDMVDAAVNPDMDTYDRTGTSLALSLLMYDSDYSGEFLTAVADGLDDVERNGDVPPGFWSMRSQAPTGLHVFFPEDARETAFDPMVSVFGSMADQPGVALDWWDDTERQEYWIAERTWAHDDFRALASVLNAASTDRSLIDPPLDENGEVRPEAAAAAELASAAITYLPQNADFGSQTSGAWLWKSHEWGGEAAGADLANIVSTYMPAAAEALTQNRGGLPDAGNSLDALDNDIPVMPFFSKDDLATVIQVASRTDEGFAELRSGVSAYNNQVLSQAASESTPGDSLSDVANAIGATAELEGFFAYNVGGGNIEEAAARAERNQAWVDLGSDLLGAVPVPGGAVVGFVADQAISVTADQVNGAVAGAVVDEEVDQANALAEQSLDDYRAQVVWALDEAGALPHQQDGADPLPDTSGVRDGQLITPEYIDAQPEDQRSALMDEVVDFANSGHGLGAYAIDQDIDGWFKGPFIDYFENGEAG